MPVADKIVIIPTYNEIENVALMVHNVMALEGDFHLMIVDDNSPDGTAAAVAYLQSEYPGRLLLEVRKEKAGLGTAYLHGFKKALAAGYTYIFEMDCDFSHDPKDLLRLYAACREEGFELAIGSRYVRGVNVVNWPIGRVLMSYFASVYVRYVTGMPVFDTTAGFKCYHRSVLETIQLERIRFIGYAFQIEMKFKTWKYGFRITEVPIIFTDRTRGQSKMSTRIFREAIFGVLYLKISSFFRTYYRFPPIPEEVAEKK